MNRDASHEAREADVRERLGRPEYRALFQAIRRRLEASSAEPAKTMTLQGLTRAERQALADLHGWREIPPPGLRLSLDELDAALRESAVGMGLVEAVELLGGPLVDRSALRAHEAAAREALWSRAASHAVLQRRPELAGWLEELRGLGLVARAARRGESEADLLDRALEAVDRLPAGGMALPVFASELTGDAHALDPGQPLSALVLRAAAHLADWPKPPTSAAERRRLWAEVGIACDSLSAQVLTLGLRPLGDDRLGRHLRESSEDGEPRRAALPR